MSEENNSVQVYDFFKVLADRLYKENNLSDVTYALLAANSGFRKFFLDFFFPGAGLSPDTVVIEREHAEPGGRPDFWIRAENGTVYIVEFKIWDGNHHFNEYVQILEKDENGGEDTASQRLGYIANYSLEGLDAKGCRLHTWKEFEDALAGENVHDLQIQGYLEYLKRVCPNEDFKLEKWPFCLADFKHVKDFYAGLEAAIEAVDNKRDCKLYTRSSRDFKNKEWMGRFFEFTYKPQQRVWAWIGVYYTNKGAELCVEFEDLAGWGRPVCDAYRSAVHGGSLRFYFQKTTGEEFTDETVIERFLKGVVVGVRGNTIIDPKDYSRARCAHDQSLLAMKAFPLMLEAGIRAAKTVTIDGKPYEIVLRTKSDEVRPESYCGVYFDLVPRVDASGNTDAVNAQQEAASQTLNGWMGVFYNENCKYTDGDKKALTPEGEPVFVCEVRGYNLKEVKGWYPDSWGWLCRVVDINKIGSQGELNAKISEVIQQLEAAKIEWA